MIAKELVSAVVEAIKGYKTVTCAPCQGKGCEECDGVGVLVMGEGGKLIKATATKAGRAALKSSGKSDSRVSKKERAGKFAFLRVLTADQVKDWLESDAETRAPLCAVVVKGNSVSQCEAGVIAGKIEGTMAAVRFHNICGKAQRSYGEKKIFARD